MDITDILDWILRIVGLLSIFMWFISLIFNFFKNKNSYLNINIISNPSTDILNSIIYYNEFNPDNHESNGESTLLFPSDDCIYNVKLYKLSITKRGTLKKDKLIFKEKKLLPNTGILFNIYKNCGAPGYMISWKNKDGANAKYEFYENGFNGNNNLNIIEYKTNFINRIFNYIIYN